MDKPNPHDGAGGSYVNLPDGTRKLVERTEDRSPRISEEVNPKAKPEPVPSVPTPAEDPKAKSKE